ncbi:unnamed protein product [Didymodactylos carnosus]|uniref:Tc1-like transposase DDE domain-containing protein n=1 Tax=Didymodactylos carnosus TaxID=1234261 RepID=A0A814KKY3_9BILA|nr:unnamed protein product [Didymodactylos carnosus]CAF3822053.1 unnamed protein product [Didymodactylos carnosus]
MFDINGACAEGLTPLVILDKGSVNHDVYIKKVLPIAQKYANKVLGDDWTFQQDNAPPHRDDIIQKWCRENMPQFISCKRWPANSPDLNLMDYCIWDELNQAINWSQVQSKSTLIKEQVSFLQNDGNFLR